MPQHLALIVLVDVNAALKAGALEDNIYLLDNMSLLGSENEGTGNLVTAVNGTCWCDGSQADEQVLNWLPYSLGRDTVSGPPPLTPVITDITGEAVDQQIIYPAQYGSPDLVTDGWYWSASVDTSHHGTFSYTLEIELHRPVKRGRTHTWEPVHMSYGSRIRIESKMRRNGFTKADTAMLPIAAGGSSPPYPYPQPYPEPTESRSRG
ncbi:hypothetical protein ACGFNU_32840 [Spirillospora sp. NPDC048911]|uniref:hypothetical protein n=1 Tax=Spirillospora sp. NPDC048911 TaxID=3364527 RepID=UPI003714D1D5